MNTKPPTPLGPAVITLLVFAGAAVAVYLLLMAVGCKSSQVTGGSSRHHTEGLTVEYTGFDGTKVTVSDDRNSASTTQPSVTVNGSDVAPRLGPTTQPEDFGGISFDFAPAIRKTFAQRYAFVLAGIFLACALAMFLLHRYIWGVAFMGVGILSALNPNALAIGAGLVVLVTLFIGWRSIQQLGAGIRNAQAQTPPDADVVGYAREVVDAALQKVAGIDKLGVAPPKEPLPAPVVVPIADSPPTVT